MSYSQELTWSREEQKQTETNEDKLNPMFFVTAFRVNNIGWPSEQNGTSLHEAEFMPDLRLRKVGQGATPCLVSFRDASLLPAKSHINYSGQP